MRCCGYNINRIIKMKNLNKSHIELSDINQVWDYMFGSYNENICEECGLAEHLTSNSSGDITCENCGWEE